MAEPLNRLISSTQTIGGAASITGTQSPITPVGATGIGANQDAAKMAGTPNQKQSALVRNLRETRSETDQAAFAASAAPKKSKTAENLARAFGLVDKLGNLANRVGQKKLQVAEKAAEDAQFPTAKYLTTERMQTVFPELPAAEADSVSGALAVLMDGVNLNKNDPRLQDATRTLANAKKADGSPLFPTDVLKNPDAMRKLVLPPEAVNMTQSEMVSEILSRVSPDMKLADLNSPSFLEAVGGPGFDERQWQEMVKDITGKEFDGTTSWGQMQAAVKDWQAKTMTDYNVLQDQARSSNANVAQEANQRLRELGFFGGQTNAERIQNLDIDKADDVAIPGTDATLDDVISNTPKGKQALIDMIVQGEKDPAFWDTLPGNLGAALKATAARARSLGQITPEEIAGISQTITGDTQTRKAYTSYTKEDGTPQDFTPLQLKTLEALGIKYDPRNPVPPSMTANPFFRMLSTNAFGRNTSLVVGLMEEAQRTPALMEFLRTADEGKIRNSRMFSDPAKFKAELISAEIQSTTAAQAKAGNPSARAELIKSLNLGQTETDVAKELKRMVDNGVTKINGVSIVKTIPGKPTTILVPGPDGRPRRETVPGKSTTIPLSPMELAEALSKTNTPDKVVANQVNTLDSFRAGLGQAKQTVDQKEATKRDQEAAVKAIRKDLSTNATIRNSFGQAKATAESLKTDTGLMGELGRIFGGTAAPHTAHNRVEDLANKVTAMKNALTAITGMPSYDNAANDPKVKEDIAALRRQISESQAVVDAIASITSPKGGKMPDITKLPSWIRNSPQFDTGQQFTPVKLGGRGGKGGGTTVPTTTSGGGGKGRGGSSLPSRGGGGKP